MRSNQSASIIFLVERGWRDESAKKPFLSESFGIEREGEEVQLYEVKKGSRGGGVEASSGPKK